MVILSLFTELECTSKSSNSSLSHMIFVHELVGIDWEVLIAREVPSPFVAVVCTVPSGNLYHPLVDSIVPATESFCHGEVVQIQTFPFHHFIIIFVSTGSIGLESSWNAISSQCDVRMTRCHGIDVHS